MPEYLSDITTIPYGTLGIVALPGTEELAHKVDDYLIRWRGERSHEDLASLTFKDYNKDSYILNVDFTDFGTGEGKCTVKESVRGYDLYFLCDPFNLGVTFNVDLFGQKIPCTPDVHYARLKRAISACAGKARRINVIMPMLYEGRQHKRVSRESLDCALMLQELCNFYDVENFITFDAHDPRVMNAIPLNGFENVYTTYQMIKALVNTTPDLIIDKDHLMVISPDEGGMNRAVYYSSVLGVDLGMFYKRRDYSRIVNGKNPIIAHEFLGSNVKGKDLIVIDDMISSGDSMIDTAKRLKEMGAKNINICCAFGLFCNGFDAFDKAYENGYIHKVYTSNLTWRRPELKDKEWYCEVSYSKYLALIIDSLNHDMSLSPLLDHAQRIKRFFDSKGIVINIDKN